MIARVGKVASGALSMRCSPARLTAIVALGLGPIGGDAVNAFAQSGPDAPSALRVELAVEPETVRIGEPFDAAVQVISGDGFTVDYLDFVGSDTLEALGPVRTVLGEGGGTVAIDELVAWVAGVPLEAQVPVRVADGGGAFTIVHVRLRVPTVSSVLPPEPAEVQPRPPTPLLNLGGGGWPWWVWLLLLLGVLGAGFVGWLFRSRVRGRPDPMVFEDPRGGALRQLDEEAANALRKGSQEELYRVVSEVMRTYLWRLDPAFGRDLTTTELFVRMRGRGVAGEFVRSLEVVLNDADRVKFARHRPEGGEAQRTLEQARAWVVGYPPPMDELAARGRAA